MKKIISAILLSISFASICVAESLAPKVEFFEEINLKASKLGVVQQLPTGDWTVVLAGIIKIILAITGSLALVAITVGGVMMITAQGNEESISKGKNILLWSILALLFIAASYGIVLGITQLQFFE